MYSQITIEERVEGVERCIIYGFLAVATFIGLTQNNTYLFGINLTIFDLIVFFISFPLSIYYIAKIGGIVGGRYGESTVRFVQKYESKLVLPFFLVFVLISGFIMHLLGKELNDIISSIFVIFIGIVINIVFIPYFRKTEKQKEKL